VAQDRYREARTRDESRDVEVTVERPLREAAPTAEASTESGGRASQTSPGADEHRDEETGGDGDPIYDLFELGAVEFVEEVQARR